MGEWQPALPLFLQKPKPVNNDKYIYENKDLQKDLVRIEKMGNKTFMVFAEGEVSESLMNIDTLESTLKEKGFIRIHQKHLVNEAHFKNRFDVLTKWVTLDNGDKVPLGSHFISDKMEISPFRRFIHRLFHFNTKKSFF